LRAWQQQEEQVKTKLQAARENYEEFADVKKPAEVDTEELQRAEEEYEEAANRLELSRGKLSKAEAVFNRLKGRHQELRSSLADRSVELKKLQEKTAELSAVKIEKRLNQSQAAERNLIAAQAGAANEEEFIAERQQDLKKLRAAMEKSQRARKLISDLSKVRDTILHRDKLPAKVHAAALLSMEDEINENLVGFDSPFAVTVDDSLEFTAHFADGTKMPGSGLSGGQKVMLALAFRMALNSLFADEVGMMILDEPTDGLDVDNRRLAATVFQRLGRIAKDRGHQIILITHDDFGDSVFDQKLVL
jgi:exonuclease SbcC